MQVFENPRPSQSRSIAKSGDAKSVVFNLLSSRKPGTGAEPGVTRTTVPLAGRWGSRHVNRRPARGAVVRDANSELFRRMMAFAIVAACGISGALAGPWSGPLADPTKLDAGIPGFIGPHGEGKARDFIWRDPETGEHLYSESANPDNYVNPLFFAWAETVESYLPAPGVGGNWLYDDLTLGPVTAAFDDVATLGDLSADQVTSGIPPGEITVRLAMPIKDLDGADFAIFENAFVLAGSNTSIPADLAFVEVSSDGLTFARIPSRSLTGSPVSQYGTVDATNIHNLAGKHGNNYFAAGASWGTPFDLADLADHPQVISGDVELTNITHVRLIDIPGTGDFPDSLGSPIYDPSVTIGSGGFDLEAVGAISVPVTFARWTEINRLPTGENGANDDPDGDGIHNLMEAALGRDPRRRDTPAPSSHEVLGGQSLFAFNRDTRLTDLIIEVQTSTDLKDWKIMARSTAGGPLLPVAPFSPVLEDVSASHLASVGVIRRHTVKTVLSSGGLGYFRLRVSLASPL